MQRNRTALRGLAPSLLLAVPALAQHGDPTHVSTEGQPPERDVVLYDALTCTARGAAPTFGPPSAGFLSTNQNPEGDMPRALAFSADGAEVVIANRDTDSVTFQDVASGVVTHTVSVGDFPVDVAVAPDNSVAVVPNVFSNSVSVIDVATHTLLANVPVTGAEPYRVAITSDSAFAVVGVINDAVNSALSVIDLGTLSEVRSIPTISQGVYGAFFTPEPGIFGNLFTDLELSSDDVTCVLADRAGGAVVLYDITTGAQLANLPTAAIPTDMDISRDGTVCVVEHEGTARTVTEIDLVTQTISGVFTTPNNLSSRRIKILADKSHAIVGVLNEVQFVNLTTGAVTSTVSTGSVGDIELSFDGAYAFVSNFNSRVIDTATQSTVATLSFAAAADAAASPVAHRMAALNNRFREDVHLYRTDGGSSAFLGAALSGEIEEGDAPRTLALSGDGGTALVVHNTSDNAVLYDVGSGTLGAYMPTGLRSLGAAISADGTTAVVANAVSDTASVLDLTSGTRVADLFLPEVPAEVLISPDGSEAYVTSLAGTDRLWFLSLTGATSSITGSLVTGQMGSIGYTYGVFSGIALSPDGSTLAVCISFDDELLLVDTQTRSEVARVPVGDFPIRARFSPDGSRVYVTHSFSDDLYAIDVNGAASSVAGTVGNIEFPLQVDLDATGAFAYVGSFDFSNPRIRVVDTNTLSIVGNVPLASRPRSSTLVGSDLYVTLTDGELVRIDAAGAASSLIETVALSGSPSDMVFSPSTGMALCAQPGTGDGIDVVSFGTTTSNYCVGAPNSVGAGGQFSASGSTSVGANDFTLEADALPTTVPGLFFYGTGQVQVPFGDGFRCVGGDVQRLFPPVQSDGAGHAERALDFTTAPVGMGPRAITPGSTWNFQLWYRDVDAMGAGFNLTDGLTATFQP